MSDVESKQGGARVRVPPPVIFVAAILAGAGLRYVFALRISAPLEWRLVLGGLLIAGALLLGFSAIGWFRKTGQDPKPWMPSPELILRGPYKYSRNPMYLSMMVVTAGIGLAIGNGWVMLLAIVALLLVHTLAVLPEEAYLAAKFGAPYLAYKEKVRRYL